MRPTASGGSFASGDAVAAGAAAVCSLDPSSSPATSRNRDEPIIRPPQRSRPGGHSAPAGASSPSRICESFLEPHCVQELAFGLQPGFCALLLLGFAWLGFWTCLLWLFWCWPFCCC